MLSGDTYKHGLTTGHSMWYHTGKTTNVNTHKNTYDHHDATLLYGFCGEKIMTHKENRYYIQVTKLWLTVPIYNTVIYCMIQGF